MAEPLLQIEGLSKRFGGVVAADAITLDDCAGRIPCRDRSERRRQDHADRPARRRDRADSRARIRFDGTDITRLAGLPPQPARARALVPDHLALLRVHGARQCRACRAGACAAIRSASGATRAARRNCASPRSAALARVGLARRAGVRVARLSHGEHRQLEIAMALAAEPQLLLLDEPMAGMGPEESARMVRVLRASSRAADDPADRARHGSGVRARRPPHRAGLRPDHRQRRSGDGPGRPGRAPSLSGRKTRRAARRAHG